MNKEEKEAIERAKFLVSIPTYLEKEMCKNLLNYIEKLQKENKNLKIQVRNEIYVRDSIASLNLNLKQKNEKQQKVIDLMGEHIVNYGKVCVENYGANKEEWIKYFEKKVEE